MARRPSAPPAPQIDETIVDIDVTDEMRNAFLEYSVSVIHSRALPDARDGLKPVHRRILWSMSEMGLRPDRGHVKSSRVVGDVMGKYHPHGDSAIYDTLVRLAQPWAMRYPLIDGQGNFGSAGDDGAAAPRYTECRMQPLAMELVRDITEDTVDFEPNYDGRTMQPIPRHGLQTLSLGDLVEELSALHTAHTVAFHPSDSGFGRAGTSGARRHCWYFHVPGEGGSLFCERTVRA